MREVEHGSLYRKQLVVMFVVPAESSLDNATRKEIQSHPDEHNHTQNHHTPIELKHKSERMYTLHASMCARRAGLCGRSNSASMVSKRTIVPQHDFRIIVNDHLCEKYDHIICGRVLWQRSAPDTQGAIILPGFVYTSS